MSALQINPIQQLNSPAPGAVGKPKTPNERTQIFRRIRELGVTQFGFRWAEVRNLPKLINQNETLGGVVQGRSKGGHVLLAATDKRIIFFDKKPLFTKVEDMSFEAISAITLEWVGFSGTLILHTKLGDIKLRVNNRKSANIFRQFIETRCIDTGQVSAV